MFDIVTWTCVWTVWIFWPEILIGRWWWRKPACLWGWQMNRVEGSQPSAELWCSLCLSNKNIFQCNKLSNAFNNARRINICQKVFVIENLNKETYFSCISFLYKRLPVQLVEELLEVSWNHHHLSNTDPPFGHNFGS